MDKRRITRKLSEKLKMEKIVGVYSSDEKSNSGRGEGDHGVSNALLTERAMKKEKGGGRNMRGKEEGRKRTLRREDT